MNLHIIKNYRDLFPELKGRALTDEIVRMLMKDEGAEDFTLVRSEKGKPYDADGRIRFSLSHTGDIFGLVVADFNIGLDLQRPGQYNYRKLADRFFTEDEIRSIGDHDDSMFMKDFLKIWTRKEALSKYRGTGLSDVLSGESVLEVREAGFIDFELADGTVGSVCVPAEERDNEISISYRE